MWECVYVSAHQLSPSVMFFLDLPKKKMARKASATIALQGIEKM